MLIILGFSFLYHKLRLFLLFMYITPHLHVVKDSWNFEVFKHTLNLKIFKFHNFLIMSVFSVWIVGYYHLNFFSKENLSIFKVWAIGYYHVNFFTMIF
jgi:hypothetical protein